MSEYRKKLIEVALPLEAINKESAREKSIRHGHPSTLHLWWARRPLAACRAVLFAQMVDDPSYLSEEWKNAEGLAEDVRYYVKWMRDESEKRIGHLYPKVQLPKEYGGSDATVIAWIWARTVICPNPACGARMPLLHSFALSTKKGRETWVEPVVDRVTKVLHFEVRHGVGAP